MRVIAGKAKGKKLKLVPGEGTRPISDRVKESVFNILVHDVPDSRFLDLFAGTGAVGIEALSQGAAEVVFVEKASKAIRVIRDNLQITNFSSQATVLHQDAFKYVPAAQGQFDIIYVAPPQYQGLWSRALQTIDEHQILAEDGIIVAQIFPKEFEPVVLQHVVLADQRKYGSTMLCFYEHV
ncbi:MAG: 16S rRNA (guanine(966)-N(2))-methyltransferase RsmD [Anaerolineae bacterium]|nr:16S rRNA (guanine(966)-N(2))-methyltransferase RsmD [Anaerolineae bacterium]